MKSNNWGTSLGSRSHKTCSVDRFFLYCLYFFFQINRVKIYEKLNCGISVIKTMLNHLIENVQSKTGL